MKKQLRKKLISQSKLDLERTIDICRGMEAAARQMNVMKTSNEVHKLTVRPKTKTDKRSDNSHNLQSYDNSKSSKHRSKKKSLLENVNFVVKYMNSNSMGQTMQRL